MPTSFGSVAFAATPATAPAAYGKPVPAAAALSVSTVLGLSPRLADQAVQVFDLRLRHRVERG